MDYDELVGADSLADPMISAMDTSQVTMEDVNRILNINDDDLDDSNTTRAGTKSKEDETPRIRLDSTASSLASLKKSDTLSPLYYTTARARESSMPSRVLGGGNDPLSYWRFGALPDDNRHQLASHRHIFDSTQNISTSFDPKKFICTVCSVPHAILGGAGGGHAEIEPKCFILSDQCFPPVLPVGGGEGVDCPALILIENARPYELAGAFLDLVRGFDVPMGTVVVISSASHLGRSGTAAYAGDIVAAMSRIREAYGRSVRVVHGFPLIGGGLVDESTVRGLREIEYWLAEVDRRRLGSLPETSDYYVKHFLTTKTLHTANSKQRQALKLPTSLHSSDSGIFVSPGWEDLPGSLPALGEEDERAFLHVMLSELNNKFALQLDTCPITDRSSQPGTDNADECRFGIVLAGSSHSVRLIDPLESTNLRVVDSTTPGFRVTDQSVAEMAAELAEKVSDLDPNDNVIVIQLLDNSSYECKTLNGDRILPKRGRDGKFHAVGELGVIRKDTLREHFMAMQPIFRAVKGFKVLVLTPLPRYLWNR